MEKVRKAAIIGTGLIGGSIGLAVKQAACVGYVTGCARNRATLDAAIKAGAIDQGYTDCAEAVVDADIVFLTTPVSSVIPEGRKVIPAMKKGAILTDAASVKTGIVSVLDAEAKAAGINFIGGHPMAGSEVSGVAAADGDLFRNAAYILTPTENTDTRSLQTLSRVIGEIGARVFTLNPEAHDRVVGTISHLPHVLSSSLVNVASSRKQEFNNIFKLAAGGFYDMTRIAGSASGIWVDICLENREAIQELISQYKDELETFAELLNDGDAEGVRLKLDNARTVRQSLPRLKDAELPLVFELTIVVPNRPKILSEITMIFADLGVNIEDIQIVHSTEADRGLLRISILGEKDAHRVDTELNARGFSTSLERRLK
jgi:prephenate dehydrogenase